MYNYETKYTRYEVGNNTGFRSELGRTIEREHPDSLLPSLPTSCYIPDGNHCFCSLTEHMVFDHCMICMNLEDQQSMGGQAAKDQALSHFLGNINTRGVRSGKFELKYDGKKLEQVTLNVNHAETLFTWYNRFLRRHIEKCPSAVNEAYDLYVKRKYEEQGLDYASEMRKIKCPSTKVNHSTHPNQGTNSQSASDHLVEPTEMQPAQEQPHPVTTSVTQPDQDSFLQNKSAECSNENPEEAAMYKRAITTDVAINFERMSELFEWIHKPFEQIRKLFEQLVNHFEQIF